MIDPAVAKQVIEQYKKHGWILRRVLFSSPLSQHLRDLTSDASAKSSPLDAFWFSRRSQPDREAWELRRVSGSPFALVVVIEDGTESEDFEDMLEALETRMLEVPSGPVSH